MADSWWRDKPAERYWLEATDREDIGADLRAPNFDASGRDNWRYTLFRHTKPGDIVFHYDSRQGAIVGSSTVAGPWNSHPITWAARGSYARERGARAIEQPGYRVPLSDFRLLEEPVSLARLRAAKADLADLVAAERSAGNSPLYFPFELGGRDLRPMQGYAFKLPASFVRLLLEDRAAEIAIETDGKAVRRNPAWDRDETILAFDLYMRRRPTLPDQSDQEVIALSDLLARYARKIGISGDGRLRNPNGVSMKIANLSRLDPADHRAGLGHGAKLEADIWNEFGDEPKRLSEVAAAIRAVIEGDEVPEGAFPDEHGGIEEAAEGRLLTRLHHSRERNRELVETKKARARRQNGRLICEGCGFDFTTVYGERGEGFMEAHHTNPLHQILPGQTTRLSDLSLLCANCHRMVHARRPWLTMPELRELIAAQRGG